MVLDSQSQDPLHTVGLQLVYDLQGRACEAELSQAGIVAKEWSAAA